MRQQSRVTSAVACLTLVGAGLIVAMPSAQAVGGSCRAYQEKKTQSFRPDAYRVRATCSRLEADSMARGTLLVDNAVDQHTVWFTGLNRNVYSSWRTLYEWEVQGTETEIAPI
jgi:hypothetical protein